MNLLDLINEVLDIASIEASRLRIALGSVDATQTVTDCIALDAPLLDAIT